MTTHSRCHRFAAALAFGAALVVAAPAHGDDRDFVRKGIENPYVYILFDVSGSMNWTPNCTSAQHAAGECPQVCNTGQGDCYTPMQADSPASKFYQAKEALYEVINTIDNVQFGFYTYNQDNLGVFYKHWMYTATSNGPTLDNGQRFPPVGAPDVFGNSRNGNNPDWECNNSTDVGCNSGNPADLTDGWEVNRVHYWPKGGDGYDHTNTFYIRHGSPNRTYRVTYTPNGGSYGSGLTVSVTIERCSGDCSAGNRTELADSPRNVTFSFVDQFLAWDNGASRGPVQEGYFNQTVSDHDATATCNGWDSNTDTTNDDYSGYNIRTPNGTTDPRHSVFTDGDVIPGDWLNNKKGAILRRLNPALSSTGFDQAPYFEDHRDGGDLHLDLLDTNQRPLIAEGSTPIGASMTNFYNWLRTSGSNSGWRIETAARDPQWGCRRKYLIVVTDGDDTCSSLTSVCAVASNLRIQEAFRTYVVAYGVPGTGDALQCIATNGGTSNPIFPQNKQELVDALTNIFQSIKEESRAFASAAVPSVEANVKDKIFLSDFTPIDGASIWAGQLDAYIKPLPFRDDGSGIPEDRGPKDCSASRTANCHLWDAATEIMSQAPLPADVQPPASPPGAIGPDPRIGMDPNERRLLYADGSGRLRGLLPPTFDNGAGGWFDLFAGLGFKDAADAAQLDANKSRAASIIAETLQRKTATITDGSGTRTIEYVMGDVFHSDPLVLENPTDFDDFAVNRGTLGRPCDLSTNSDPGYKCFAFKHQYRRKVLLVGTNDAQLHAFDTGVFDRTANAYGNGRGKEIFAYVPRMALPLLRETSEDNLHIFGVDGPVVGGDAFFRGDGQWHTIAVGGMREAGRKLGGAAVLQPESGGPGSEVLRTGFYALDVTQPDPIELRPDPVTGGTRFLPKDLPAGREWVAGCASVDGTTPIDCPRPYPKLLWEFLDASPRTGQPLDEDNTPVAGPAPAANWGNLAADLAAPWSRPVLTRVRIRIGTDANGNAISEPRFVVVIGGGLDPNNKRCAAEPCPNGLPLKGNWIYMIDAETGQTIYKRKVQGSVPAVAVLDTNDDNVADVIYAGTTSGAVYKVDVSVPQTLDPIIVKDRNGTATLPNQVLRVTAAAWSPFRVFQAGNDQPIYTQIQVILVARLGRYALAFGTGDRENLWNLDGGVGRQYLIVDQGWTATTPGLPRTDANYTQVTPTSLTLGTNLLLNPFAGKEAGWYLLLDADERVITRAFALSGILIFSSFKPQVVPEGTPIDRVCTRTGISRNFVLFTINGDAVSNLTGSSAPDRALDIPDFVTNPFVEQTQTKNTTGQAGSVPPQQGTGSDVGASCTDDTRLAGIVNVLKTNGPTNARYANFFMRIGQRMSREGVFYPACVPIAIMETNWREN